MRYFVFDTIQNVGPIPFDAAMPFFFSFQNIQANDVVLNLGKKERRLE